MKSITTITEEVLKDDTLSYLMMNDSLEKAQKRLESLLTQWLEEAIFDPLFTDILNRSDVEKRLGKLHELRSTLLEKGTE